MKKLIVILSLGFLIQIPQTQSVIAGGGVAKTKLNTAKDRFCLFGGNKCAKYKATYKYPN